MSRTGIPTALLGLLLLGGCTLAPKYSRPEAPVPAQWPSGDAYREAPSGDAPKPAEIAWQEFYTDENLREIIETSLANNRDLRVAVLNVERARSMYNIQRAELLPAAYASGGGARERASTDFTVPGQSRISKAYNVDLGVVAWEVDLFGRVRSLEQQALEAYFATEQARRSAQLLLISSVADAYLSLAASREALALSERTLQTQEEAFGLVRRQYERGIATELDLRRAEVPVEAARGDIARYTQQAARAENALRLLAGGELDEALVPGELSAVAPPASVGAGLSSEVLLERPDVIAAERRLRGAYAQIGAARAAFFPRISLTSTVGTASIELSDLFASGTGTWSYAAQISMPIFDARTWAAYNVSQAERDIAVAQYEKAIQTAFREVADALAVRGTVDRQVAAQEALVHALAEAHRLSLSRFEKGIDSYLGVLDAQRSLFDARQGLISLRLLQRGSQVRLYAVLGGGWRPEELRAAAR